MVAEIDIKVDDAAVLAALERLRDALGGSISVAIGTNVVYGPIHQLGGKAGRRTRRVTIPARPFLGDSREDRTELLTIANNHLERAWDGDRPTSADVARAIGRYFKTSTQLRFRAQQGPDGKPWQKSKRVLARGGQTLRLTSRLRNSVTYAVL